MALADNVLFAHFCDSLDQDYPTSDVTRSNPSGANDPNVNSGVLEFDNANSEALRFTIGTGEFWEGGTGDWTMAARATIATAGSFDNTLMQIGPTTTASRNLQIQEYSAANLSLMVYDTSFAGRVSTGINVFTTGTPFVVCVKRTSGVCTIWVDGADETDTDQITTRDFSSTYSGITMGAHGLPTTYLDGSVDWAVMWGRALSDSEIINNLNETDLKAMFESGGQTSYQRLQSLSSGFGPHKSQTLGGDKD